MNSNDIICMAREAEADAKTLILQRFAALVAAAEREACAKVCESQYVDYDWADREKVAVSNCAAAIRARGQT